MTINQIRRLYPGCKVRRAGYGEVAVDLGGRYPLRLRVSGPDRRIVEPGAKSIVISG